MRSNSAKPRVILRADAGASIGFGHFVRTAALAAYLRHDFDCTIYSRNPDGETHYPFQTELAREAGAKLENLALGTREEFDPAFLEMLDDTAITVLDNYYYDTAYQQQVRNRSKALVCIDDMHDRHFVADLLMTFCPLTADDFSMEPYTQFRGGIEWSFLREPFLAPRQEEGHREADRVVIAMGGADPYRLTDKVVRILRGLRPELSIDVLAGQTVKAEFQEDTKLRVLRCADSRTIAALFDRASFGIFPASTVCVEAFSRRLPVAAGHYVDNQEEFYAYGVERGWFAPLGCLLDDEAILAERLKGILETSPAPAPDFGFTTRRDDIVELFRQFL